MKKIAIIGFLLLAHHVSYAGVECKKLSPNPSCSAAEIIGGVWDFVLTNDSGEERYQFEFTNAPTNTCINYGWYKARLIAGPQESISHPAYRYDQESGNIELLLNAEFCDSYSSLVGSLKGSLFEGKYVIYGLSGSVEHGKVTGSYKQ